MRNAERDNTMCPSLNLGGGGGILTDEWRNQGRGRGFGRSNERGRGGAPFGKDFGRGCITDRNWNNSREEDKTYDSKVAGDGMQRLDTKNLLSFLRNIRKRMNIMRMLI